MPSVALFKRAGTLVMTPESDFSRYGDGANVNAARCAEVSPAKRGAKMRFVHQRRHLNEGDIVQVDCDAQCNFMLLSDADYAAYQRVRPFKYCGGTFKRFPARITVPETGDWNIVIDLAGARQEIRYNITVVIGVSSETATDHRQQLAPDVDSRTTGDRL